MWITEKREQQNYMRNQINLATYRAERALNSSRTLRNSDLAVIVNTNYSFNSFYTG